MSVKSLILYLILLICDTVMFHMVACRNFPTSYKVRKIKLKHFWFLFNENAGESYRTHEVSLSVFIFSVIGYIVNTVAILIHIICFHFGLDTTIFVLVISAIDWIGCFLFAIWVSSG